MRLAGNRSRRTFSPAPFVHAATIWCTSAVLGASNTLSRHNGLWAHTDAPFPIRFSWVLP